MSKRKYKVASLFSGCGGMDLGFLGGFEFLGKRYAKNPFQIVWANELNAAACRTYSENVDKNVVCGDIWDHIEEIPAGIDVLIGGFPCQDISINGKMAGVYGARSGLYKAMVEAVRRTQPKIFVAENVKGLLLKRNQDSLKRVIEDFSSLGYSVSYDLYHVADYGVPQLRERVVIVGTRDEDNVFIPPKPTLTKEKWITIRQAIDDLKDHDADPKTGHIWSTAKRSSEQGNRTMNPDLPGYTIRAECHGNIQFHYEKNRRISMREAARVQSFPDTFSLPCGLRETERQLGNAVPPVFAWHVAKAVAKCLENTDGNQ